MDGLITEPPESTGAAATARSLVYASLTVPMAVVSLVVLVAGWAIVVSLSFTPLVVPLLVALAAVTRAVAGVELALVHGLLDAPLAVPANPPARPGYWTKAGAVLSARDFWRRQAFLALRVGIGLPGAVTVIAVVLAGLLLASAPLTYRWVPNEGFHGLDLGVWRVDTFIRSLVLVPIGLVVTTAGLALSVAFGVLWRQVAISLLMMRGEARTAVSARRRAATRHSRRAALSRHALATAGVLALLVLIWALTTHGYGWPFWPALGLGFVLAEHALVVRVLEARDAGRLPHGISAAFAVHAGTAVLIQCVLVAIWAATTPEVFWPVWCALGFAVSVGVHLFVNLTRAADESDRRRSDAIDVQERDLRRIERDLHDGPQARLVALGLQLGRAERSITDDPAGARTLVREAREQVSDALAELRDLVRGIRPPVLTDRGLDAAVTSLADRMAIPVDVHSDLNGRLPDSVETTAYFVVAESLANTAKHADATQAAVDLSRRGSALVIAVSDDGQGGADVNGSGLQGLRMRVEAQGGSFAVDSPDGGPTLIRAEIPCER